MLWPDLRVAEVGDAATVAAGLVLDDVALQDVGGATRLHQDAGAVGGFRVLDEGRDDAPRLGRRGLAATFLPPSGPPSGWPAGGERLVSGTPAFTCAAIASESE